MHPDAFDVIPYEVCRAILRLFNRLFVHQSLSLHLSYTLNYCTGYQRKLEKAGLWFIWECL
jgi:hypothetical protein